VSVVVGVVRRVRRNNSKTKRRVKHKFGRKVARVTRA